MSVGEGMIITSIFKIKHNNYMKILVVSLLSMLCISISSKPKPRVLKPKPSIARIKEAMSYFLNIHNSQPQQPDRKLHNNFEKNPFDYQHRSSTLSKHLGRFDRTAYSTQERPMRNLRRTTNKALRDELSLLKDEFSQVTSNNSINPYGTNINNNSGFSSIDSFANPSRNARDCRFGNCNNQELSAEVAIMKAKLSRLEAELARGSGGSSQAVDDSLLGLGSQTADALGIHTQLDAYSAGGGAAAFAYGTVKHDEFKKEKKKEIKHLKNSVAKKEAFSKVLDDEQVRLRQICDEIDRANNRIKQVEKNMMFRMQQRIDHLFF